MSHHVNHAGDPYVECDNLTDASGVPLRCGRRSYGSAPRFGRDELSIFDLPHGWSVAPYSDAFDHGATRTSLIDGRELKPFPHLIGISGDLHTCPSCNKRRRP